MKEQTVNIDWTAARLKRFNAAYAAACVAGVDTFRFEGNEFVVSYAKYLIEYLQGRFNGKR
jgi:hypothetical protein